MNQALCSKALGLGVTIRKTGTTLGPKKGLLWGSNGGGWQLWGVDPYRLSSHTYPFPSMPCMLHWQHTRARPLPVGRVPKPHRPPN